MTGRRIWGALGSWFVVLPFLAPCVFVLLLLPASLAHPQPCQILKRIGHTVRVGALHLQPRVLSQNAFKGNYFEGDWDGDRDSVLTGEEFELISRAVNEHGLGNLRTKGSTGNPNRGAKSKNMVKKEEDDVVFLPRDSILLAMETLNRMTGLLPYNLSLDVVMAVETGLGELPAFSFASASTPLCSDPVCFLQSVCHTVIVQGVSAIMAFPQNRDELLILEFISSALQVPVISVVQSEFKRQSKVSARGPCPCVKKETTSRLKIEPN